MSVPSSRTRPVIHPPSVSSCIRLSVRRNVDLPHPDGPISACTRCGAKRSETPFTAVNFPYIAASLSVSIRGAGSARGARSPAKGKAGADTEDEHDEYEDEGAGPGQLMPLFIGTGRIGEDGERQGRHRPGRIGGEVLAAQGREQERGRLSGNPRHREQAPGDDPGQRAPHDNAEADRKSVV